MIYHHVTSRYAIHQWYCTIATGSMKIYVVVSQNLNDKIIFTGNILQSGILSVDQSQLSI